MVIIKNGLVAMKIDIFVPAPQTMIYIRFWPSMWTFIYDIFVEHHET